MDLFELLKGQIGHSVLEKLAGAVGIDPTAAAKVLEGGLPALLGGILAKAQSPGGGDALLGLLGQSGLPTGGDELVAALGDPDKAAALRSQGDGMLGSLFGDKLGGVLDALGGTSGAGKDGVGGFLAMLAPLVLGFLGKNMPAGTDGKGLASWLGTALPDLGKLLPGGLGSMLGLGSAGAAASGAAAAVGSAAGRAQDVVEQRSGSVLPWVVGLAAVSAVAWWLSTMNRPATTPAGEPMTGELEKTAGSTDTPTDGSVEKSLPGGVSIRFPAKSVEADLVGFIEDPSKTPDKSVWFSFDRLEFETGSAVLKPSSQEQLKNVAAILAAYPAVKVKIGGYTDNTGDPAANMKLSSERAMNTMNELAKLGVASDRMESEGYGDQHPVADNATEEGRQKNRRIDINVTAK